MRRTECDHGNRNGANSPDSVWGILGSRFADRLGDPGRRPPGRGARSVGRSERAQPTVRTLVRIAHACTSSSISRAADRKRRTSAVLTRQRKSVGKSETLGFRMRGRLAIQPSSTATLSIEMSNVRCRLIVFGLRWRRAARCSSIALSPCVVGLDLPNPKGSLGLAVAVEDGALTVTPAVQPADAPATARQLDSLVRSSCHARVAWLDSQLRVPGDFDPRITQHAGGC